ncbi:MAG: response regulator transcription factor [Planctomycetales bacterium]
MSRGISVLLVDDHALFRQPLAAKLTDEEGFVVVGDVGSAHEAVAEVARLSPDVVLMDVDMPGQSCFEAAKDIHRKSSGSQIIFLSAFFHDRYIEQALSVNALGYLTKNEPVEKVISAIRSVAAGEVYFSPEVISRIVVDEHGARLADDRRSLASLLTAREVEVLRHVARGLSKKEIADALHISVKTVENHTQNLMTKLDIHDRVKLALYAVREGLSEA